MKTKRDILILMHELLTVEEVLQDVEDTIVRAANSGSHRVEYKFPERADQLIKDKVYAELEAADFRVYGLDSNKYVRF